MDQIKENKTVADSILKIDLLNEKNEKTNLHNEIKKNKDKNGMVIFIYPKASTPGCTKQAQLFKENFEKFVKNKYYIYGLSADSPKAQSKWKQKLNLQYDLLCDEEKKLLKELGCLKGNSIIRSHLIIKSDFNLSYFRKGVSPTSSAEDVLNFLSIGKENGNIYENSKEKKKSKQKINENEKGKNKKSVKVKKNKNGINKTTTLVGKKTEIKKNKNSKKELNNKEENKKELKRKTKNKGENIEKKKEVKKKEVKEKENKEKSNVKKEDNKKKNIKKEEKKNLKIKNESKKELNNKEDNKKKSKNEEQKKELNNKEGNIKKLKNKNEKKKIEKKNEQIKKNTKIKDANQNNNEIKNGKKVKKVLKKK